MNDIRKWVRKMRRIILLGFLAAGLSALWGGRASAVQQSAEPKIVDAEPVIYLDGMDRISVKGEGIQSVSYSSSAKKVARVDRKGKVTPVKKGTAVIRAKVSYKEDGRTMEKVLSYQLRILGKSTEYFKYDKYKVNITGLTSKGKKLKEVHIPGYIGKSKVSGVHADAFRNNKAMEKVYTPDNLVYLDYFDWEEDYDKSENFIGCTMLRELHLGKNLREVGYQSDHSALEKITVDERNKYFQVRDNVLFSKKNTLELYPGGRKDVSYQIPEGIKKVEWHAFSGAKNLKHIAFSKGIEDISLAFDNSGLVEVTIPESVKDYGGAFSGCKELEKAVIESKGNGKWPEENAFRDCIKLKTVVIPGKMDGSNFSGCQSLERFTLSSKVKDIISKDDVLFSEDGKTLLLYPAGRKGKRYALPAGIGEIGKSAFEGVQHLEEVVMNPEVISIGRNAFLNARIAKVALNQRLQKIGDEAFAHTDLIHGSLPDSVSSIGDALFADCKKLQSVRLSENIEEISANAFIRCTSLKAVRIPKKVRKIEYGEYLFTDGCKSLSAFTVDRDNQHFTAVGGVLYSKSKKTLYAYPLGKKSKKFSVPRSVKKIAGYAFEGQAYLQEVSMNQVSTLGNHAFGNSALRKVAFSKKLKSLPLFAFAHCRKLKKVAIPDTIRSVADGAFKGCTSLKIVVAGKRADLKEFVFEDCKNLRQVTFRRKIKNSNDVDAYARNETYKNAGSSNYRKLVVKVPGCSKKYRKMAKRQLYGPGCLDKKAKLVFGKVK